VVALAVAIAGMPGQRRALDGLPGRGARHRGGVDQPQLVTPTGVWAARSAMAKATSGPARRRRRW
jgi:hypothetical protein